MISFSCRWLILLPCLALAGCGGGNASPNPETSGPVTIFNAISRLDFRDEGNNRFYDIYICDPTVSGEASVEMRSPDIDCALMVYRKNADGEFDLLAEDDQADANPNDGINDTRAVVNFEVERGASYRIVATSGQAEARGNYEVEFSEELGRPALVLPKAGAANQGLILPPLAKTK